MRRLIALALVALRPSGGAPPTFVAHEIATGLRGGYQTIAADLNKDGRMDLVAVATGLSEVVWFENPTWTRHVLISGTSAPINAAAQDVDGDGIPEIALAYGFSTNPAQSAGNVVLLTHGTDVTQPWTSREIDRVPTAHRMRWLQVGSEWVLFNSPLSAATAQAPAYEGNTPIYAYRAPGWKRELVTEAERGVVHAIEPIGGHLFSAGFAGVHEYAFIDGAWRRFDIVPGDPRPAPAGGSSEIKMGSLKPTSMLASIEPWHGNQLVVYRDPRVVASAPRTDGSLFSGLAWRRSIIDTAIVDGHTVVIADFDDDGLDEIVVGQRAGTRSLWLYAVDATREKWSRMTLDEGGMAGAGCVAVDLNGDRKIDIACIGTATANLKWYENVSR